jgi:hypothetical protein
MHPLDSPKGALASLNDRPHLYPFYLAHHNLILLWTHRNSLSKEYPLSLATLLMDCQNQAYEERCKPRNGGTGA